MKRNRAGSVRIVWLLALLLSVASCGEKKPDQKESAKLEVPTAPPKPTFDKEKAKKMLLTYGWEGVSAGKPALLLAAEKNGQLVGAMVIGEEKSALTITLEDDGKISMETVPVPTGGDKMTQYIYSGSFDSELKNMSGKSERVVKSGFMEEGYDGGDWTLAQTKTQEELQKATSEKAEEKKEGATKGSKQTKKTKK